MPDRNLDCFRNAGFEVDSGRESSASTLVLAPNKQYLSANSLAMGSYRHEALHNKHSRLFFFAVCHVA
jgi:hypothetical protein